ncbi:hypothetical protein AS031_18385 [Pseudarthrobacter enclensis]|uniref:Uncharacterized protein n=1 Tax=Pseudarthrobacter enclensis TaxID=993070 RepID=A0A0V8I5H2_9MICC|nr:hypothetical protein AS031_18385 [Pseudarthrobacter enclensis]
MSTPPIMPPIARGRPATASGAARIVGREGHEVRFGCSSARREFKFAAKGRVSNFLESVPGLLSCATWDFGIDPDRELAEIALYYEDSLVAFQGSGYQSLDCCIYFFVRALWVLHRVDFQG